MNCVNAENSGYREPNSRPRKKARPRPKRKQSNEGFFSWRGSQPVTQSHPTHPISAVNRATFRLVYSQDRRACCKRSFGSRAPKFVSHPQAVRPTAQWGLFLIFPRKLVLEQLTLDCNPFDVEQEFVSAKPSFGYPRFTDKPILLIDPEP